MSGGAGGTSSVPARRHFERTLPALPSSVAEARQLVELLLSGTDRVDLVDAAALLVSEVVTNALLHAGTPIDVAGQVTQRGLRVEVGDGSPHIPVRRAYGPTAGTGRGLVLLEQLVDAWGVSRHGRGKTVWFTLSQGQPDPHEVIPNQARTSGATGRDVVVVELRNSPLLLHAAWQEHAETLLRELLLANLDADDPDPIATHAEATNAIAVLEEHLPRHREVLLPDRLMEVMTEPEVSAPRLAVPVPRQSVAHFATLDRALESALALAGHGRTLAPWTPPEVQAFRRWVCGQVREQAAGGSATPWVVPEVADGRPVLSPDWDDTGVSFTSGSLLAADLDNRIVAVSPATADLLGYDDPAELVGRRLVAIIPERYRQAHVAGFTMYLLVDRGPLLETTLTLPALCRDGSERLVELTVRALHAPDGTQVLLAELAPVSS